MVDQDPEVLAAFTFTEIVGKPLRQGPRDDGLDFVVQIRRSHHPTSRFARSVPTSQMRFSLEPLLNWPWGRAYTQSNRLFRCNT